MGSYHQMEWLAASPLPGSIDSSKVFTRRSRKCWRNCVDIPNPVHRRRRHWGTGGIRDDDYNDYVVVVVDGVYIL